MTDEFEKLESAFRKQTEVEPRAKAKADALKFAMDSFEEEKISTATQGTETDERLNKQGNKETLFNWRRIMRTLDSKLTYTLAGGASMAVLALVAVNGGLLQEFMARQPASFEVSKEKRISEDSSGAGTATQLPAPVETAPAGTKNEVFTDKSSVEVEEEVASNRPEPKEQDAIAGLSRDDAVSVDEEVRLESTTTIKPDAKPLIKKAPRVRQSAKQESFSNQQQAAGQVLGFSAESKSLAKIAPQPAPVDVIQPQYEQQGRDKFEDVKPSSVKVTKDEPVSTFSVDVDTASYAFMRSSLNNNVLPPANAIRVEELINYFDYDYAGPADKTQPFKANVQIMPTPWNEGTKLMSIGIKGYELDKSEAPAANLVFLIDTSGSMNAVNKLPLLRNSFKLLLSSLKPDDTVSIVTYAGRAGTVLEPTKVGEKHKILAALDNLNAGGSTAGAAGIHQAYKLAEQSFDKKGINRVILATDGDFNVGISDPERLKQFVEKKRKSGVTLSVLGFGRGNYNDHLMQKLAQNGNGNASYIDTLSEARKVLVEEAGSTLFTIAKDVKLQVEFNPALVGEYRLIGYETRALKREDFNNDKVDAGDIGAGHTVTVLYEITPANSLALSVDPLRYGDEQVEFAADASEYGFMKIRYKLPDSNKSNLITTPITVGEEVSSVQSASQDTRFATSVAAFGQLIRGGQYTEEYSYDDVISLAQTAKGEDEFGYRSEFINLVRLAQTASDLQK